jgi:lipopolysaccharide transport system ATP-binding protein
MSKNNNNIAIEVKNISKKYILGEIGSVFLREEITNFFRRMLKKAEKSETSFLALKDVSFSVNKGEAVGIIGPNGAGKSTILKILSRITYPSTGTVKINGRVASLLEVGTGFNPELTGRENIYLNGAILGMTRREISSKFDDIVNFAEIDKFLDTPVKRYSSGMYIRLAFSIAAHLEPEILLIDEVLAVGDAKFQKKSLGKMDQVTKGNNRTIIFVSHDLGAIKKICKKCILIDSGKMVKFGPTKEVIEDYLDMIDLENTEGESKSIKRTGSGKIIIESVKVSDTKGKILNHVVNGETIKFIFNYNSLGDYKKVNLSFSLHTQLSQNLILHQSKYTDDYFDVKKGKGKIEFVYKDFPLISGIYLVNLRIDINGEEADFPRQAMYRLRVIDGDFYKTKAIPLQHSPVLIKGDWSNKQ